MPFQLEWFAPWITFVGDDPKREGLRDTPARMAAALEELLSGYSDDPLRHFSMLFDAGPASAPVISSFPFFSMCEHHMLPFFGDVELTYKPHGGRIVGLSKIPRGVAALSRRLQTQERLTAEIATAFFAAVCPEWVTVTLEARHLCMESRGVGVIGRTITSETRGTSEALR